MPDDRSKEELLVEIERLHRLLDKTPACLMRVGPDGKLLAVSDVAVDMLGARTLSQVLGTNLVDYLRGEGRALWSEFVQRISEIGSGSVECELEDLGGTRRTIMLLGVLVADHPDRVASVVVAARDLTTPRRLEASLQEHEGARKQLSETFDQLARSLSEAFDSATLISTILRKQPPR